MKKRIQTLLKASNAGMSDQFVTLEKGAKLHLPYEMTVGDVHLRGEWMVEIV